MYKITDCKFEKEGKFNFKYSFTYDGLRHTLPKQQNTIMKSALKALVKDFLDDYEASKGDDNFAALQKMFENDMVVIDGS